MPTTLRLIALLGAAILCPAVPGAVRQSESVNTSAIACRVLEAHASVAPAATAVIFHQQNNVDQERLGSLLRAHSGEGAEIQIGNGNWTTVTVFRLKSCFGRGLLLLPASGPPINDGSTFLMRFTQGGGKN